MECNCRDLVRHFRFQQERYSPGYYGRSSDHGEGFAVKELMSLGLMFFPGQKFSQSHFLQWQFCSRAAMRKLLFSTKLNASSIDSAARSAAPFAASANSPKFLILLMVFSPCALMSSPAPKVVRRQEHANLTACRESNQNVSEFQQEPLFVLLLKSLIHFSLLLSYNFFRSLALSHGLTSASAGETLVKPKLAHLNNLASAAARATSQCVFFCQSIGLKVCCIGWNFPRRISACR